MSRAISAEGLALVKRLEGFRAAPLALPDGRFVVGYGHVQPDAPADPLREAEADAQLRADLAAVEALLNERVLTPLSQSQFDALVSFAFSIGADAFARSDVLRRVNAGETIAAGCAMEAWRKSSVAGESAVLDTLVRRRAAEKAMFLDLSALQPAASAFVRPELDHAVAILGSPTRVAALPSQESVAPAADETARRLADILAREPNTAHALKPPPAPLEDEDDEEPLVLTRALEPAPTPTDITRLAAFGAAGAILLVAGLAALGGGNRTGFLLMAVPGAVALLSAAWRLTKDRVASRFFSDRSLLFRR